MVHGTAVVRAVASPEDVGEHRLTMRVLAPGGAVVIEQISNPFTISESGQKFNSIIGFSFPAEAMGRYCIVISVDGQKLDEYSFEVEEE